LRKRIVPLLGCIWGCGIIVYGYRHGVGDVTNAYSAGQTIGYLVGWAMAAAGLSALLGRRQSGIDLDY